MGSTLLELTRSIHEDIERFQKGISDECDYNPKNYRQNVVQSHRVNRYLDKIVESSNKLLDIYADKDGTRRDEINNMSGSGPNLYSLFYDRLREIKDYHRKFPELGEVQKPEERLYFDENEVANMFTGEEGWGKALDLHYYFDTYINLKGVQRVDYLTYLEIFWKFNDILDRKANPVYKQYISDLSAYVIAFLRKSQPLLDLDKPLKAIEEDFEQKWSSNEFSGWETINEEPLPEDHNPLFCKACNKLFSKDTVFKGHLNGKKHLAAQKKLDSTSDLIKSRKDFREVYHHEFLIHELSKTILQEQIDNTRINIEKKQSRTMRELEEEPEEEEEELESYDPEAEEPEVKMTIDNYPIGWDGKPIPYWLYKLHGLGVEYKCEICGNTSYWGRKAYEKHFQEWRHAHGMRCLGIPNTRHFHDITTINDAVSLWSKIRKDKIDEIWKPETEEEYEDKEGNVFNKKTYEDLKRQGLI